MILELNKQRVTSDYVELFKLQTPDGWLYFTTYETAVYMRDKESPFTNRQYLSLPIDFTGWEQKSEGTYARPQVTFANVITTFSDALNQFEYDDLVGLKIIRRKTLAIHLDNAAGNAHGAPAAPTEYPTQSYIIDRVGSTNASTVTLELASPFDVAGVMIPARNILPHTCCWAYQGNASDTPYSPPIGACTWKVTADNNGPIAFFDNRNNLFITGHTLTGLTGTSSEAHGLFRTAQILKHVSIDGTVGTMPLVIGKSYKIVTAGNTDFVAIGAANNLPNTIFTATDVGSGTGTVTINSFNYWQAAAATSSTPYRRVRPYTTYSGGTSYYTYVEGDLYNDVVVSAGTVWVCIRSHTTTQVPAIGSKYWKRADVCGKKLSSCAVRYKSQQVTIATGTIISTSEDKTKVLQYGGFPASRRYNFTG